MFPKLAPALALLSLGLATLAVPSQPAHAQTAFQKPVLTTLHTFDGVQGGYPFKAPVLGKDGFLYGTTANGGLGYGCGIVYKLNPATNQFKTLFAFNGYNGKYVENGLICGSDGNLYGVAESGGVGYSPSNPYGGAGIVFRITPDGKMTTLHQFAPLSKDNTNDGGNAPFVGLVQGANGTLYGMTGFGGHAGAGTIFQITSNGAFSVVHDFHNQDGNQPLAPLSFGPDGALYGSMSEGGAYNNGTIFRVRPGIDFHVVRSFTRNDAYFVQSPLLTGPDDALYGAAHFGSTLFKITLSGQYTTLYRFPDVDGIGIAPSDMTMGADGNFYGATDHDGEPEPDNSVFRLSPDGSVTSLYKFHAAPDGTYPHGACPGGVTYGGPGVLYGVTEQGGVINGQDVGSGTIFKLTLPQ